MKALLNNYRQSPRKARLVAGLIRGKSVEKALELLSFSDKKSSEGIKKLLISAVANAQENDKKDPKTLFVKEITVDKGIEFRRFMPRAFGRATPFRRSTSRVAITLGEKNGEKK